MPCHTPSHLITESSRSSCNPSCNLSQTPHVTRHRLSRTVTNRHDLATDRHGIFPDPSPISQELGSDTSRTRLYATDGSSRATVATSRPSSRSAEGRLVGRRLGGGGWAAAAAGGGGGGGAAAVVTDLIPPGAARDENKHPPACPSPPLPRTVPATLSQPRPRPAPPQSCPAQWPGNSGGRGGRLLFNFGKI